MQAFFSKISNPIPLVPTFISRFLRSGLLRFFAFWRGLWYHLMVLDWVRSVYFRHLVYIDQRFRLHRRFGILGEPSPCPRRILRIANEYPRRGQKRKRSLISQASLGGGDSWTRTNDPIDVNDVLYRLSHATTLRFEVPTKVSYQLSHATLLFNVRMLHLIKIDH